MNRQFFSVGGLPADSSSRRAPFIIFVSFSIIVLLSSAASIVGNSRQRLSQKDFLEAEQRLSDLGYWTGPVDGKSDVMFSHALVAFQKVEGRRRTGRLTKDELNALRTATKPLPRLTGFAHIEVDLARQVMFMVDENDNVLRILPVCTGNGKTYVDQGKTAVAHTPRGSFKVLRKINGWRRSTLGLLYYPTYIHGGIAIHGSPAILAYPASHGCIRIPMFAAKELSGLVPVGMVVVVYEG